MNNVIEEDQQAILPDDEDEYAYPKLLGNRQQQVHGSEYTGRFTGRGWLTGDYDEGSFLADMTFAAAHATWKASRKRHRLAMEDLFPEDWNGSQVEYEITVTARRVRKPAPSRRK
jgi:hypothetical protein